MTLRHTFTFLIQDLIFRTLNGYDTVEIKNKNNYPVKIGTQMLRINENAEETIILAKKVKELDVDYLIVKPYSQHPGSLHKFKINYDNFKNLQKSLKDLKFRKI